MKYELLKIYKSGSLQWNNFLQEIQIHLHTSQTFDKKLDCVNHFWLTFTITLGSQLKEARVLKKMPKVNKKSKKITDRMQWGKSKMKISERRAVPK